MGSSQSSPEKLKPATTSATGSNASTATDTSNATGALEQSPIIHNTNENNNNSNNNINTEKKKKKAPPKNLTGYALVEYKCRKKKARYDRCYREKHGAFVIGRKILDSDGEVDETSCEDLFQSFQDCIYKGMMKDRKKRGLKTVGAESALGGYYFEDGEE